MPVSGPQYLRVICANTGNGLIPQGGPIPAGYGSQDVYVPIPAGAVMHVNMASANHDEARWENGEQFDLWRQPAQHMAIVNTRTNELGMHFSWSLPHR